MIEKENKHPEKHEKISSLVWKEMPSDSQKYGNSRQTPLDINKIFFFCNNSLKK